MTTPPDPAPRVRRPRPPRRGRARRWGLWASLLGASLLGHAASFYALQVSYPPATAVAPAPPQITLLPPGMPESAAFRDRIRPDLIAMAGRGELVVPVARTFPLEQAREALDLLQTGHPGGKLALVP